MTPESTRKQWGNDGSTGLSRIRRLVPKRPVQLFCPGQRKRWSWPFVGIPYGYTQEFAERPFRQLEAFGSYGFPASYAASFALIAYVSSWLKCHHPDVFCAALLNSQPMGLYAPPRIVRKAREHEIEVRPICVNQSRWVCTPEGRSESARLAGFASVCDRS